jgi:hypothetical protein
MNPAGVGTAAGVEEAYRRALATDPVSAFGGIVAFNRMVDEVAARALTEIFTEVVVAPDFEEAAVEVLKSKKNLRILRAGAARAPEGLDFKRVTGGMLVQTRDTHRLTREDLKVVTRREPTDEERLAHPLVARVRKAPGGYNAERTRMDLPVSRAVIAAVQSTSEQQVVLMPTLGGSLPLSLIRETLGVPTLTVPIANYDNNQHAENENIRLQNLWDGIETYAALMTMKF